MTSARTSVAASFAARFDAIVFDKDGTLLDFAATWDPAIASAIEWSSGGDLAKQDAIARKLGFDMERRTCRANAPVIHDSNTRLEEMLNPITDGRGRAFLDKAAELVLHHVTQVPAATKVLTALREAGIRTAVATNDDELAARQQCERLGWLADDEPLIDRIFGCDSGHGGKPEPGMLLAAAAALNVTPSRCAMIGDSAGDLKASKAAGFAACFLVGPAIAVEQHAPLADHWIIDLEELILPRDGDAVCETTT